MAQRFKKRFTSWSNFGQCWKCEQVMWQLFSPSPLPFLFPRSLLPHFPPLSHTCLLHYPLSPLLHPLLLHLSLSSFLLLSPHPSLSCHLSSPPPPQVWNFLGHQPQGPVQTAEQEDSQWGAPAPPDPQMGWGAHSIRTAPGRGAGQGLPYHLPRRGGGIRLSPRVRVPQTSQHIQARSQGVCL